MRGGGVDDAGAAVDDAVAVPSRGEVHDGALHALLSAPGVDVQRATTAGPYAQEKVGLTTSHNCVVIARRHGQSATWR